MLVNDRKEIKQMNPSSRHHLAPNAFTLIELLVVISIIALLIGILLPALASARHSAWTIQCAANQRQVFVAMSAYSQNHKDWIAPIVMKVDGNNRFWPVGLGMEVLNMQVFDFSTNGVRPPGIFACPASEHVMDGGVKSDWGRSNWICRIYGDGGTDVEIRNADMIKPGSLLALADSDNRELSFTLAPPNGIPSTFNLNGRHKGNLAPDNKNNLVNVAYFDGHVVRTAIKELPTDSSTNDHKRAPWTP
jgi:prepilin-type N-terminal cleavage/methylation domain-containing protein/prepilin-type processing-associated H-X9-DG protein